MKRRFYNVWILLISIALLTSCGEWSKEDYSELESIKAKAMELVDKSANESYADNKTDIDNLNGRIQKLIDGNKPKVGVEMLSLITDKSRKTWGGFLNMWESQGNLSSVIVGDVKTRVQTAFDEVLALGTK